MGAPAPVSGGRQDREVAANFKVEFDSGETALVTSVTGINMEARYAESRQGTSSDPDYSYVDMAYGEVTITGTVVSQSNSFSEWMTIVQDGGNRDDRQRDVRVIPLNADKTEKANSWNLLRCNPRSYTPGDFDATSQDPLTFTMTLQPSHVGFGPTP